MSRPADASAGAAVGAVARLTTVVIPARNSFAAIATTLDEVLRQLDTLGRALDARVCVVVNTALTGPCAAHVRQYRLLRDARVDLVELPDDKAAAIRWAIHTLEGRDIAFVDADFGWEAPDRCLADALRLAAATSGIVLADRDMTDWSQLRRAKTRLFRSIARGLLGLPVIDTQAPLKVLPGDFVGLVRDVVRLRGWEFDVELLWFAHQLGFQLVPLPVHFRGGGGETWWASVLLVVIMGTGMVVNLLRFWVWTLMRGRSTLARIRGQRMVAATGAPAPR